MLYVLIIHIDSRLRCKPMFSCAVVAFHSMTCAVVWLGSTDRYDGGTGNDIKSRLNKARDIFRMMNKSTKYSIVPKVKLYQSCVLSTLLYVP